MSAPSIIDNEKYDMTTPGAICVQVISGTPVMTFSQDDFATSTTVDLTASPSYPNAAVDLPICRYRFALSGAVVKVGTLK